MGEGSLDAIRLGGGWEEEGVRERCVELLERLGACILTEVVDRRVLEEVIQGAHLQSNPPKVSPLTE